MISSSCKVLVFVSLLALSVPAQDKPAAPPPKDKPAAAPAKDKPAKPAPDKPAQAPAPAKSAAAAPTDAGWTRVDLSTLAPPIIDEETSKKLFVGVRSGKRQKWDPLTLQALKENTSLTFKWDEHEGGVVTMKTNNMGFRRDTDTQAAKSAIRVVVSGDSHTDGLVDNSESFVTLLENQLNAQGDGKQYECINAGVGGAGPHVYLGMLRKALDLHPDLFIVMLYAGNDFSDAIYVQDHFSGRKPGKFTYDEYQKPLDDAIKQWNETALIGNSFNQAYRFKKLPDEKVLALTEVGAVFDSMIKICADKQIRFVVGIIPTKADVDEDDRDREAEIMAALGLTPKDMEVNWRMPKDAVKSLRLHQTPVMDPTEKMKASTTPYYWLRDHHLNVEGNKLIAGELFPVVAPLLKDVAMPAEAAEPPAEDQPKDQPAAPKDEPATPNEQAPPVKPEPK